MFDAISSTPDPPWSMVVEPEVFVAPPPANITLEVVSPVPV
jgi:hypothetical protein